MFESENPIAIRSKRWIASALLELMKEKPFNKINIQEITSKADLDRRTFYRNFKSKEDILSYHILQLSAEYSDELKKQSIITIPISLKIFCEIAYKHKDLVMLLLENDLSILLLDVFNEALPSIHKMVQEQFSQEINSNDIANVEYIFAYNAGGFWNILNKWFRDNNDLSPSQIADIVENIIVKMFQQKS